MEIEKLVQRWNEIRVRLEELRREQLEFQRKYETMSKRILQFLRENPKTQLKIGDVRLDTKIVHHYPNLSQRFLSKVLLELLEKKEGEKLFHQILEYRQEQVKKVTELKIILPSK
jgi:hypothetical protein